MKETMFYIENTLHRGDCCLWWRPNGEGYTRNLDEAWRVDGEDAKRICSSRPEQDVMRATDEVDATAVRHLGR